MPRTKTTSKKKVSQKKDIVKEVKKEAKEEVSDDEPSWYHYIIVLIVLGAIITGVYLSANYFFADEAKRVPPTGYFYEHKVGEITYNIQFHSSFEELDAFNVAIEPTKNEIFNTDEFIFSFDTYNGSDNGRVVQASSKFRSTLAFVYKFTFNTSNFAKTLNVTCADSTIENKIVTFNPYASEHRIGYNNSNGCIEFESTNSTLLMKVVDKFIYEYVVKE